MGSTNDDDGADAGSDTFEKAGMPKRSPGFQTCPSARVGAAAEDEAGTIAVADAPAELNNDDDDEYGTTHDDGAETDAGVDLRAQRNMSGFNTSDRS